MSEEEQHRLRAEKVDALRHRGVDPYPVGFRRSHTGGELHDRFGDLGPESATGERVAVAGRLVGMRDIGKLCFGVLTDWSGSIQLFADVDGLGDRYADFIDLDLGDWVGASGEVITTRKGELSVRIEDFTLLAKSLHPLPEKWHGLSDVEVRYRRRYLDLIANADSRRIARTRSTVIASVRRSMEARGFVEVEGPVLQLSAGGALARPFITHHNALDIDMYLRIALELHLKRLTVGGIDKVFEIGRVFRNEGVSPMHNPEFTMLESYEAFADYHQVMELTEQVLAEAAEAVHGGTAFDYQGRHLDLAPPWERRSLTDEVEARWGITVDTPVHEARAQAEEMGVVVEVGGTGKVIEELFERFIQPELWEPVFFVDYPLEVSPLAREHREGGGIAERFEAFVAGLELANGYSELNDPVEQRRRFAEQAAARAQGDTEAHPVDEDYIQALEYGLPPTGGLGIGIDRTVMLLADVTSVREVILFPHLRPEGV